MAWYAKLRFKSLDFTRIKYNTEKSDVIDRDESTPLLNETKAKEQEKEDIRGINVIETLKSQQIEYDGVARSNNQLLSFLRTSVDDGDL